MKKLGRLAFYAVVRSRHISSASFPECAILHSLHSLPLGIIQSLIWFQTDEGEGDLCNMIVTSDRPV
jgi:hypothetical protein